MAAGNGQGSAPPLGWTGGGILFFGAVLFFVQQGFQRGHWSMA